MVAMEVCREDTVPPMFPLPLDRVVPSHILARRFGISFSSGSNYYSLPRLERRGGISFERTDKNALYVRMLGDVRVRKHDIHRPDRRRPSLTDSEMKILDKLALKDYRTRCGPRFLSMHETRRRRQPLIGLSVANAPLYDDMYSGQAQCLLSYVGNWDFDIFNLDRLTAGRSFFSMSLHLFPLYNLVEIFKLDIVKVMRCMTLIEDGYHGSNPFHNAVHAADVTQAMHCYLQEAPLRESVTPIEIMAALIAAMTHDLDHPGVNQAFLIATSNHIASLYHNVSVLENHHYRTAIAVIHETKMLNHIHPELWYKFEWQLKSLILATDITRQQEFLNKFKKCLNGNCEFDFKSIEKDKHFVLQIALKCADISNPCRPWHLSKRWSEKVCDEFFNQGDCERQLQVPVTPMCDRFTMTVAKVQIGFFEFVVLPLFREWDKFANSNLSKSMITNVCTNKSNWQAVLDEALLMSQEVTITQTSSGPPSEASSTCQVTFHNGDSFDSDDEDSDEDRDIVELTEYRSSMLSDTEGGLSPMRSLSPVSEDGADMDFSSRRHSMPPAVVRRDISRLTVRRESFPRVQMMRRRSLPRTQIYQATSYDRLMSKLSFLDSGGSFASGNKTISLDSLFSRPKISNLSPNIEASQLATTVSKFASGHHTVSQFSSKDLLESFQTRFKPSTEPRQQQHRHSIGAIIMSTEHNGDSYSHSYPSSPTTLTADHFILGALNSSSTQWGEPRSPSHTATASAPASPKAVARSKRMRDSATDIVKS